jgi:hypothetical protein
MKTLSLLPHLVVLIVLVAFSSTFASEFVGRGPTVPERIATPPGYERLEVDSGSFGAWIRELPLKPPGSKVYWYNGMPRPNQDVKVAVYDIDVGQRDLQQCADVAIRLRAEYLYDRGLYDSISFNFTNGDTIAFRRWIEGWRPRVDNDNEVTWRHQAEPDSSRETLKEYLEEIYMYSGSYSLSRQLPRRQDPCDIEIGDLFIEGGFPGHVVFVVDVAVDEPGLGRRIFLLAQGFTPAQDIHVLKNPQNDDLNPWYECEIGDTLVTPEWKFKDEWLRRWE